MSETKQEPIFMEQDEYLEYLRNKVKLNPELAKKPIAQLNMYQMNKDLVRGLKKMTNMEINKALEAVHDWFNPNESHYALLNHEQHYFTIFERNGVPGSADAFIKEVKDILMNHYSQDIRAIDVTQDNVVEIWAMWPVGEPEEKKTEPTVAYLFPYSEGVVYYQ